MARRAFPERLDGVNGRWTCIRLSRSTVRLDLYHIRAARRQAETTITAEILSFPTGNLKVLPGSPPARSRPPFSGRGGDRSLCWAACPSWGCTWIGWAKTDSNSARSDSTLLIADCTCSSPEEGPFELRSTNLPREV